MKFDIERRSNLTYDEFSREYLIPNRPVIITDGLKEWRAVGKWTPDFFENQYRSKPLTIGGQTYAMGDFIERVKTSAAGRVAPYFRNELVKLVFPELLGDLTPTPSYILPNWLRGPFYPSAGRDAEIYIGGTGGAFPFLHYDANSTHAFLGQVYGDKEAVLYAPEDTENLYPKVEKQLRHQSWITDTETPDLGRFPLFAKAKAYRGTIKAGHLLFIPNRWWHTARMLTPSITISYNVANHSNWDNVTDEICYKARASTPLLSPVMSGYMKLLGCGQTLVDRLKGSNMTSMIAGLSSASHCVLDGEVNQFLGMEEALVKVVSLAL